MKVTLTVDKALTILQGLLAIRKGYQEIIVGDDGKKRAVPCAYKLDMSIATRIKLNIAALSPIVGAFEEARNERFVAMSKGCVDVPEFAKKYPAECAEWLEEIKKEVVVTHDFDLHKLDEGKLLEKNDNILDIVMNLGPILNEAALKD